MFFFAMPIFLQKMLCYDPKGRITAKAAMQHAFHEDIRNSMAVCG